MLQKLLAISVFAGTLLAQHRVAPGNMYHHVWAVTPLIGAGTPDDPKRPMFTPAPAELAARASGARPDLVSFSTQLSDNGNFALVELVFVDPLAYERALRIATAAIPGVATTLQGLTVIDPDGSNASALTANIAARKAALESAVPGLKLFERGKTTRAQILAEFQKYKASFTFPSLPAGVTQ